MCVTASCPCHLQHQPYLPEGGAAGAAAGGGGSSNWDEMLKLDNSPPPPYASIDAIAHIDANTSPSAPPPSIPPQSLEKPHFPPDLNSVMPHTHTHTHTHTRTHTHATLESLMVALAFSSNNAIPTRVQYCSTLVVALAASSNNVIPTRI